jgi:hypothetical protein
LRSALSFLLVLSLAVSVGLAAFPHAARAASPSITVTPYRFGSGQTVDVSGTGFAADAVVNVWFDGNGNLLQDNNEPSDLVQADASGAFAGATFVVKASAGSYFVRAGTPAVAFGEVQIGSCLFQICTIDGHQTVCILGNAPSDTIPGINISVADCKELDSSYTDIPNGYNFGNFGPRFAGAGILAAAVNSLNFLGLPGPGCATMTAAIAEAESPPYFNSVPGKFDLFKPTQELLNIACGPPFGPLGFVGFDLPSYISIETLAGHGGDPAMGDALIIAAVVAAAQGTANPVVIGAAQIAFAKAAVAGAIVCGFVDYYCNGSDITANIMARFDLQKQLVPLPFFNKRWGDIIGWAKAVCSDNVMPPHKAGDTSAYEDGGCETNASMVAQPGTAGPNNVFQPIRCATGTINGMSIGYDGDISFDVNDGVVLADGSIDMTQPGPKLLNPGDNLPALTNYHNFQLGPEGSGAPDGIDIEIPITDRGRFMPLLVNIRKGLRVQVCGFWVADMHMLWNELHPMTSLSFLPPLPVAETPPVITPHVSGTLGANGWYTSDVSVTWTISAPDSPVSSSSGCGATTISTDTSPSGLSLACTATNAGGTTVNGVVIKRDATPPTISHLVTPAVDGAAGWYVSAPTITFSCSDSSSGLANCTADGQVGPAVTLGESAAAQSAGGTATDIAGNVSHDAASGLLVDLSNPTINSAKDRAPNANGWYNAAVTVTFTCADAISGVSACSPSHTLVEGANQSASGTVIDVAGRSQTTTTIAINIDMTRPVIVFTGNAGAYTADQTIVITCAASDTLSGIATTSCPAVASGPATNYIGTTATTTTTIIATAVDNAGNSAAASTTFTVTVTPESICQLSASLGLANAICAHATSIENAPNAASKAGKLHAFDNFLAAQSGNGIPEDLATLLSRLAHLL